MKHYIQKALLGLFTCIVCSKALAQTGFDKIYSFAPYPNFTVYSLIRDVLPDTQHILVSGMCERDTIDLGRFTGVASFIGSFDYSGNLLWKKKLAFTAPHYYANEPGYFRSLQKMSSNKYVFCGQGWDGSNGVYYIPRWYVYFFNVNGDSLKFAPILNGNAEELSILNATIIDRQNNIVFAGNRWNNNIADTVSVLMAKCDSNGNFLWRKIIHNDINPLLSASADKIINSNDGLHYLLAGQMGHTDTAVKTTYTIWKTDMAGNVSWRKMLQSHPDGRANLLMEAMGS